MVKSSEDTASIGVHDVKSDGNVATTQLVANLQQEIVMVLATL